MAPPTLVCDTWQYVDSDMDERGDLLGRGPFRELAGLRAGNEYEFFQPIHPDDVLNVRWLVKDVYERAGLAPARSSSRSSRPPSTTSAANCWPATPRPCSTGRRRRMSCNERIYPLPFEGEGWGEVNGSAGRFFEDVSVGEELPPLHKQIDLPRMMAYGAATWDFIRVHYDADHARELGFPGPFVDGQMLGAFLAQHVQDWAGPGAFLRKLAFRNRVMVYPGDSLICRGVVTRLYLRGRGGRTRPVRPVD